MALGAAERRREVPTDRLSNGLYAVVLLADGLNVGSTKFEIIR